jgi:ubiquinone/menaquinone biosynthesis C-methylase UbiE/uncharacterized protein YbaR (Trm112 family)
MRKSSFNILACPKCKGSLILHHPAEGDVVESGDLSCMQCLATYPVEEGIVHSVSKHEVMTTYPQMEEQARKGARFYDYFVAKTAQVFGVTPDDARAEYLERLEIRPQATILDVGVGTGGELGYLWCKTSGVQMFGVDISIEMLHECRRRMAKLSAHAELFVGFAERLPFKDNTFDVVFHAGSINEFKDQRAAIEEMIRVAKPGTRIVVTDEWLTEENIQQPIGQWLVRTFPSLSRNAEPPVHCMPSDMKEITVDAICQGYGYCIQFRKPA